MIFYIIQFVPAGRITVTTVLTILKSEFFLIFVSI